MTDLKLSKQKNSAVTALYLTLAVLSIPHLIDDFLFDIPEDFGISNMTAQILAGVFILIFMLIFKEIVQGTRIGMYGAMLMGSFLALAGILKHIPLIIKPGPYWSGLFSEGLIIGMIIAGIALTVSGNMWLKENSQK